MSQKFTGRNDDLSIMNKALDEAKTGKGKLVLIEGDSGFGKSGLVREFMHQLKDQNDLLLASAECNDIENLNAYAPFKELIIQLNSNTNHNKKDTFKKIRTFVSEAGTGWIGLIPVVGSFAATGIDTYKAYKDTFKNNVNPTIEGLSDVYKIFENEFKRLSENKTLVVYIDDLQWADSSSLNLIYALGKAIKSNLFRILIIGSYRPLDIKSGRNKLSENNTIITIRHPFADKLNELRNYLKKESHIPDNNNWFQEIKLKAFTFKEVNELINSRYPKNTFSTEFYSNIFNLTNGLPLFVVEILDYLFDNEFIQEQDQIYSSKNIEIEELPPSIQGVISEKVEKLEGDLKKVLTFASVNGKDFTLQVIEHISKIDEDDLFEYLDELMQKHNIISEKNIENSLGDVFAFTQTLTQQFIYKKMSHARRKSLHRKIAAFINDNYHSEIENNKEIRDAYNYHNQVGQGLIYVNEDDLENDELPSEDVVLHAAEIEIKNAKDSFKQFAIPECYAHIEKAMAFVTRIDDSNNEKQIIIFDALSWKNLCQLQEGLLDQALNTAFLMRNIALEYLSKYKIAEAYLSLGGTYMVGIDNKNLAIETNQKALDLLSKSEENDTSLRAEILSRLGHLNVQLGKDDIALKQLEEALELFIELEDVLGVSQHYTSLSELYKNKKEYDDALFYLSKSLEIDVKMNNFTGMAINYFAIGNINFEKGNVKLAKINFEKAEELCIKINDNFQLAKTYLNLANTTENTIEIIEYLEKSISTFKKTEYILMTAYVITELAELYDSLEDYNVAINKYKEAIEIIKNSNEIDFLIECYSQLCAVLDKIENYEESIGYLEKSLRLSQDKYGADSPNVDIINFELAKTCYMANFKSESEDYLKKSISYRKSLYGIDSEEYQTIINLYNELY